MKILCVFSRFHFRDAKKGVSYEYANFLPAIRRLGHSIEFIDSGDRLRYRSFIELNHHLIETTTRFRPDVIFFVCLGYEIWSETLDYLRARSGSVLINWGTDDSWKYNEFTKWIAPHFHIHATTSPEALTQARQDGIENVFLTQWAANSETLTAPRLASECEYAVSFIGSAYGNRRRWINRLVRQGIEVACFGHGWPGGSVEASAIPRIIRNSRVSLNFADSSLHLRGLWPYRSRQIKARVFEVPGNGGFLLTQSAPHLEEFFVPGREVDQFNSPEDLQQKVEYYLSHSTERDRLASAGHQRCAQHHTYEVRFQHLLEFAEQLASRRNRSFNQGQQFNDGTWFEDLRGKHRAGMLLRIVRWVLVAGFALMFGTVKGRRAARRLAFELSWRVLPTQTYSAAGFPGRMFFRES